MLTRTLRYTSRRLRLHNHGLITSVPNLPSKSKEEEANLMFYREFHATKRQESIMPLAIGVGVACTAITAKYALDAWDVYQKRKQDGKPLFGGKGFGASFYKGGFQDTMDRKEAALILGLRESADKKRIQDHHRRLLRLNHPDTGGSTFIATKINEAKDMLLKN